MAKAKKDKKVVVNQAYFELIERKAKLLDSMYYGIEINAGALHDFDKIRSDWDKVDADQFEDTEELFNE